jgi:hypothetical protein
MDQVQGRQFGQIGTNGNESAAFGHQNGRMTRREGFRSGDWICTRCKKHNFAKKTQCYGCSGDKKEFAEARGPIPQTQGRWKLHGHQQAQQEAKVEIGAPQADAASRGAAREASKGRSAANVGFGGGTDASTVAQEPIRAQLAAMIAQRQNLRAQMAALEVGDTKLAHLTLVCDPINVDWIHYVICVYMSLPSPFVFVHFSFF